MRFRFLGGMDCPDFVLNEVASSSKLSAIKYRQLCKLGVDVILGKMEQKVAETSLPNFVTSDLDSPALLRIFYIIRFILQKSAGYGCAAEDLDSELCQLGLPPEHSKMISRVYGTSREAIKQLQRENIMKKPALHVETVQMAANQVLLAGKTGEKPISLAFGQQRWQDLCHDLKEIDKLLEEKFPDAK